MGDFISAFGATFILQHNHIICPIFLFFLGVHRQVLLATIGWFVGYHVTKYENYIYARLDRDMNEYVRLHPEEFAAKGE